MDIIYVTPDAYLKNENGMKTLNRTILEDTVSSKVPVVPPREIYKKIPKIANQNYIESRFSDGEYGFDIIRKAINTDSYARLRMEKYTMISTVMGYSIVGPDDKKSMVAIEYLNDYLFNLEQNTNLLFTDIIDSIFSSLYGFSNCFIHVIRDKYGNITRMEVIDLMNNEISILHDDMGNIYGYIQYIINGNNIMFGRVYDKKEIIFLKVFGGKLFGKPILSSVIDDIRMLRRLEENMILQSFQYSIPPLIYKVKPANPASPIAEDPNIINAQRELESLLAHGGLVTTTESQIDIPVPSSLLDMTKYLDYAKQRVLSGLYLSTIAVGETSSANKATANVMFDDIVNHAKYHQLKVAEYVNKYIINDILLHAKNKFIRKYINKVKLAFPEIDISYITQVANTEILLYNAGLVSRNEVRTKINYGPMSEQDKNDTVYANGSVNQSTVNEAKQRSMPTNQYGTKMNPAKKNKANDSIDIQYVEQVINNLIEKMEQYKFTDDTKSFIKTKLDGHLQVAKDSLNINVQNSILNRIIDICIELYRIGNASIESGTEITIDKLMSYDTISANI